MFFIRHLLHCQGITYHMRPLDSGIVSVDTYLITQKLLILVPDNRVFVHGHTRILRIIHQGIANALDIEPVSAHLMKGMHFTVHGVGIDMKWLITYPTPLTVCISLKPNASSSLLLRYRTYTSITLVSPI